MNQRPLIFLGEKITNKAEERTHLFSDYYLERPTSNEVVYLKTLVEKNTISFSPSHPFSKFEVHNDELQRIDDFWIVTHSRKSKSWAFDAVVGLCSANLTVVLQWFMLSEKQPALHVDELLSKVFYHDYFTDRPKSVIIDDKAITEMQFIHKVLSIHFHNNQDNFGYKKLIQDFLSIKKIPRQLSFRFLAYFSILESLCTNNNYKATNNSINFQLQNKLNLINNKLPEPVDLRKYFKAPDTVTFNILIEKLYQYRSDIAHGSQSNFEKELFLLKDSQHKAIEFIHDLTSKSIILALIDPHLMRDLKNC